MPDIREFKPVEIDHFRGINDNINPLRKQAMPEMALADVCENFELTEDGTLSTRRGSMLFDRATRLRMFARAAFLVEDVGIGVGVGPGPGTYHYVGRFESTEDEDIVSLPTPVRSVTLTIQRSVLVQYWLKNNPDPARFDKFVIYRTVADGDILGEYFKIEEWTDEVAGQAPIWYYDSLLDATIVSNPSITLNDTGLGLDHPVSSITDYPRRQGGTDIIFTAGKYIKSYERGDKIYDALTPDRLCSTVVFQNAVWLVNGKDFLFINSKRQVFQMGADGPKYAPFILPVSGPLDGNYRWVFTWYDDGKAGSATEHPWESAPSPISDEVNLSSGGAKVTRNALDTPPARATHWRVYRTTSGGNIEQAQLVAAVPIAEMDYFDSTPDTALTAIFVPWDSNDSPKTLHLQFIVEMGNRLYGAGNYEDPTRLYWTARDSPEQWSILNNSIALDDNDGDHINGLAVMDGILYVFKGRYIYRMLGDPPVDADRFGLNEGCSAWRALAATKNGVYYVGYNGVYWSNGNTSEDISDYIARFIQSEVDPTVSTLRSPVIVDYTDPLKKQLICSFRTMGKGNQNYTAGVYHYDMANPSSPEGWTLFRDFQVVSMAVCRDFRKRDMLLMGDDQGRIYQHDRVKGQDRAEILNYGAGAAPFFGPQTFLGGAYEEPWDDLDDWDAGAYAPDVPGVVEINPASTLHVELPEDITNAIAFYPIASPQLGVNAPGVKVTLAGLTIQAFSEKQPIVLRVFAKSNPDAAQVSKHLLIGWGSEGLFVFPTINDFGVWTQVPSIPPLPIGETVDVEIWFLPGPAGTLYDASILYKQDGVYYEVPNIRGEGSDIPSNNVYMELSAGLGDLEFTLDTLRLDVVGTAVGRSLTQKIEQYIPGTPITCVYESPWFNFNAQHLQKYIMWLYLTARGSFEGDAKVVLYTDFINTDGQIESFPIHGGTLWDDKRKWDKSTWDGFKQQVGNRIGVDRTGNNIKVRIEVSELNSFAEIFGYTMSIDQQDVFENPKADEGEKQRE